MTIGNRFDSPIGSSAPRGRRPFSTHDRETTGASIGDGMKTSARIAGTTTLIGLLLNAGPMLLASSAGILLLLRGCLSSWTSVPQTVPPGPASVAVSSYAPPRYSQAIAPSLRPASRPIRTQPLALPEIPQQSTNVNFDHAAEFESGDYGSQNPNQFVLSYPSTPFRPMPHVGNFPASTVWGAGFAAPSNPMLDVMAAGPAMSDSPSQAISPLFSFQQGRKFAGTSQMPGEPSRRISLSIAAIRDGGSNISAKISTLEGARFSRPYTGLIEKNPWRLKLIPVRNPKSFGTFVTYIPWYSESPTDITLEISADGKSLAGTSVSSEQFELLPQFEISPEFTDTNSPVPLSDSVLDDSNEGGTQWKLMERNGEPVSAAESQLWTFTQTNADRGNFEWTKASVQIASGSYVEGEVKGQLDIILAGDDRPQIYRGLMDFLQGEEHTIRICIPATADQKRPARITGKYGNVFKLTRVVPHEVGL